MTETLVPLFKIQRTETSEPYTIHAKKRGDRYVTPSGQVFTLEERKAFYKGLGYLIIEL